MGLGHAGGPQGRWYEVSDAAYTSSGRTRGVYVDPELGFLLVQDRVNRPTSGSCSSEAGRRPAVAGPGGVRRVSRTAYAP